MSNFYEDYIDSFDGESFDVELLPKIYFVFSQLKDLIDNYFWARNKYLGLDESRYSFENIESINYDSFGVKYSHNSGCRCSGNCNYESTYVDIPFSVLFYTDAQLKEYFRPQAEERQLKAEKAREAKLEKEKIAALKKEAEERQLLAQLKSKYGED